LSSAVHKNETTFNVTKCTKVCWRDAEDIHGVIKLVLTKSSVKFSAFSA